MTETKNTNGLKIALPNGSLEANTRKLFADAGLAIVGESRKHDARVNDPLISRVTFMRPQHIPKLVGNRTFDAGVCGEDCLAEAGTDSSVVKIAELLYGRGESTGQARVVLVSALENTTASLARVPAGSAVLTEYPRITRKAFAARGVSVEAMFSYGGTEAHVPRDFPFGVCLTDTGGSLTANGLKIVEVLFQTSTMLVANSRSLIESADSVNAIKHFLTGTLQARGKVFVTMNVPAGKKQAVLKILPALRKPTIAKLAGGRYFSVGTVVSLAEKNQVVASALRAGAEGLIVQPISQIVESW